MIARLSLGLASALILSGSCASAQPVSKAVDTAKISAEVVAAARAQITAFNAHDAEKAVSADLPDVVVMFHGAPNDRAVAADLATTKAEVADPLAHVELGAESVDVGGPDFAVYHSTYDYTLTDPKTKSAAHELGNYLIGFRRQSDGALKIAWQVISDAHAEVRIPFGQRPPTLAAAKPASLMRAGERMLGDAPARSANWRNARGRCWRIQALAPPPPQPCPEADLGDGGRGWFVAVDCSSSLSDHRRMNDHERGFLTFLAEPTKRRMETLLDLGQKRRRDVRGLLHHSVRLDPRYCQHLRGNEALSGPAEAMLRKRGAGPNCYVLGGSSELDGREVPLTERSTP